MSISSRAQYALSKIYRLNDEGYIEIRGKASDKYVKSSILQNLLKYVACYNIILITQDAVLANNIFSLNNYDNKIIVKKINKNGNLKGFKKVN